MKGDIKNSMAYINKATPILNQNVVEKSISVRFCFWIRASTKPESTNICATVKNIVSIATRP